MAETSVSSSADMGDHTIESASDYTIHGEARRIFAEVLLKDDRLQIPSAVKEAAKRTRIVGRLSDPYVPGPMKMTESASALWALLATFANTIAAARFGIQQGAEVDTDTTTLFLMSASLASLDGKDLSDPAVASRLKQYDLGGQGEVYRRLATNIYPTKDKRWYHLHGSLDATRTLAMIGLPQHRLEIDLEGAIGEISSAVQKFDSDWLEITANEHYRQAGSICLTPQEFLETEQGKAMKDQPLYTLKTTEHSLPKVEWPSSGGKATGPLHGIKVIDASRIIAAPTIAKILAQLGATVIRISTDTLPDFGPLLIDGNLGKRDVRLNLKSEEGKAALMGLLQEADVFLDGYRPGALQRLGFGRALIQDVARRRGKGIVHIRENCYGWKGPKADWSGWQQISDCVTGVSWLQGKFLGLDEPVVPLLPNSDYQCGVSGAIATVHALYLRSHKGGSYNVDVSLTQFNLFYLSLGQYTKEQQKALRALHKGLALRHYDDMPALVAKTMKTLAMNRPELFKNPNSFQTAEANWGIEGERIRFLAPNIRLDKTPVGYAIGTCAPGSYGAEWP